MVYLGVLLTMVIENSFLKKVVSSIRGGFVVHMNKNGVNIKVKPEKKICNV